MSKRKWILFVAIITLAGIIVVFVVSEIFLRFKKQHIESGDHLDYGMMVYDKYLGWKLTPNWDGRHKHYDYDVRYSTNSQGFRNDFTTKQDQAGTSVMLLLETASLFPLVLTIMRRLFSFLIHRKSRITCI